MRRSRNKELQFKARPAHDPAGRGPNRRQGQRAGKEAGRSNATIEAGKLKRKKMRTVPTSGRPDPGPDNNETGDEKRVIIQIRVRRALRRLIKRLADENEETVQTYILRILQEAGVPVADGDLLDGRKAKNRLRRTSACRTGQGSKAAPQGSTTQTLGKLLAGALAQAGIAGDDMTTRSQNGCVVIVNVGGCAAGSCRRRGSP
ncbi:hypothetical protein FRZ61_01420 [Hypericibacter adhaerens]|jgi:hypothetical protein|uniref:Uncharacterized protein n=1 Tax=Hypericibacter adhaerens TaxID=2602016 RepID=A0A5J6MZX0_9PROT|nr:hypothetical protein [Hypericibacter adhaerens]QEX20226.1 hypothetical protein FRZ61_01420 [Hypericibacter adhaerens]